jgi:hypothetical protein
VIDNHLAYERYGSTRTLCEFVTEIAYAMEVSGGLNDGMSDRVDEVVAPVRTARDWLWHVGELMTQTHPLPVDFDSELDLAETRAIDALPRLKALVGEACDALILMRATPASSLETPLV